MIRRMWQRRNPALLESSAGSNLPNEITLSHEVRSGTLMRTLIHVGSETSIIAQNFVTDGSLRMESMMTSGEDKMLGNRHMW